MKQRTNKGEKDSGPSRGPSSPVDWLDFRDHLATADKDGKRRWVYPKKPQGKWTRYRTWTGLLLLGVMFIGPFVTINGNPLLMVNVLERRFSIIGQIFWPQDSVIFAVAMLVFLTSIIIFTTAFGRLWCGWTCPQTVLMEMVFRKIEYFIEGDAPAQKRLAAEPWTKEKVLKKGTKHAVFLAVSFIIGNTLLSYIIGADGLINIVTDSPRNHLTGLSFMILFTIIFYLIFARFREQACTFICPYGRFQSTMIDENTMVVAYDYKRGEVRSPMHRGQSFEAWRAEGYGDCISCHQCVAVCPTGIDIRNGTQMECVGCTACIDACDHIMKKIGKAQGLIRFASLNSIEKGERFSFRHRMAWYVGVLTVLVGVLALLVFTRSELQTIFLRAPGALFQEVPNGKISNLYVVKVVNKTTRDMTVGLRLENMPGELKIMGGNYLFVPKADLAQTSVLIEIPRGLLRAPTTNLRIGIYADGKQLETLKTVFIGPRS
jgi:cytochrome c oxidase accessory protein FixG